MNVGGKLSLVISYSKILSLTNSSHLLLVLTNEVFNHIIEEAKRAYPSETCGIMGGTLKDEEIVVSYTRKLFNISTEKSKFWFNELDWIQEVISLTSHGLEYIGLYHSHPNSKPIPSLNDLERMVECPGEIWLILSYIQPNVTSLGAWVIPKFNSGLMRIPVIIEGRIKDGSLGETE